MSDVITVNIQNGVAYLVLDHPPANVLSHAVLEALAQALDQVEENTNIKVAVITGTGKMFVAGADIKEMTGQRTQEEGETLADQGQKIFNRIEQSAIPFIAAINGICLGGGLELALACHLRYAAADAKLGQPEINLGLLPGFGGTQRLPRLVGQGTALEMMLTGDTITAEKAYTLGLVNEVVSGEALLSQVSKTAETIGKKSRRTIREILAVLRQGRPSVWEEGLQRERQAFARLFASEDRREGVAAFLERREPQFRD